MNSIRDPEGLYEVLGAAPDASPEELRDAYKREAFRWHPDRCADPQAQDRMQHINAARDVLLDPVARAAYDAAAAAVVRVWCDVTVLDAGSLDVGADGLLTVAVRFSGDPARVGVVDVPTAHGSWWSLDVVAAGPDDPADVLLTLRIAVRPHQPGPLRDEIVVEAGDQRVVIEVVCRGTRPVTTVWSDGFRRWCRWSSVGFIACASLAPTALAPLLHTGPAPLPTSWLPGLLLLAAALVGTHAVATRGFSRGTRADQFLAGLIAVPASAALLVWILAVVAAIVAVVLALVIIGAVVAAVLR